ncbi:MAG: hypothetical protein LBQ24_04040 [Candidatus Peribacteria bacterium]|nr:hypothetical protein [Candidatus Peribacteria bacterium]
MKLRIGLSPSLFLIISTFSVSSVKNSPFLIKLMFLLFSSEISNFTVESFQKKPIFITCISLAKAFSSKLLLTPSIHNIHS